VAEFHIRGDVATKELIKLSDFTSDMHILDVGCGVGVPHVVCHMKQVVV